MQKVFSGQNNQSVQAIYKTGNRFVNWYIIDTDEGITVVDAGFPGHWSRFIEGLKSIDRQPSDVKAVLLTHAHTDHMGFAEQARRETDAQVWVHEADAGRAHNGYNEPPPPPIIRNMWRPKILTTMLSVMLFEGGMKDNAIKEVHPFKDNEQIPVPGQPQAIHVSGHTIGSAAFYLPDIGVFFSGDALCTANPARMKPTPPNILRLSDDYASAVQSLTKMEDLGEVLLLPGHGQPWQGNMQEAAALARRSLEVGVLETAVANVI